MKLFHTSLYITLAVLLGMTASGLVSQPTKIDTHVPEPGIKSEPMYAEQVPQHSTDEQRCIRQAIYHEARNQKLDGMLAVASVIINRKQSKHYPNTYCEVIEQRLQFSYVDQFKKRGKSPKINVKKLAAGDLHAYRIANQLAIEIINGQFTGVLPKEIMWYARHEIKNYWTTKMVPKKQIGDHVFYANR